MREKRLRNSPEKDSSWGSSEGSLIRMGRNGAGLFPKRGSVGGW